MIGKVVFVSLAITAIHIMLSDGHLLSFVRVAAANALDKILGKKWSRTLQKPLWDCLPCMAGLWTIILTWSFHPLLILAVCGLNLIIDRYIGQELGENVIGIPPAPPHPVEYTDDVPTLTRNLKDGTAGK